MYLDGIIIRLVERIATDLTNIMIWSVVRAFLPQNPCLSAISNVDGGAMTGRDS
jgi:hypothetical protein